MLNFNGRDDSDSSPWKVIVLDKSTKDVIAALFVTADLRKHGITLFLDIDSERQPIADVSAIYFVESSDEVIQKITRVASSELSFSFPAGYFQWPLRLLFPQLLFIHFEGSP
jgi:sec1 family domain-containing protein 1